MCKRCRREGWKKRSLLSAWSWELPSASCDLDEAISTIRSTWSHDSQIKITWSLGGIMWPENAVDTYLPLRCVWPDLSTATRISELSATREISTTMITTCTYSTSITDVACCCSLLPVVVCFCGLVACWCCTYCFPYSSMQVIYSKYCINFNLFNWLVGQSIESLLPVVAVICCSCCCLLLLFYIQTWIGSNSRELSVFWQSTCNHRRGEIII